MSVATAPNFTRLLTAGEAEESDWSNDEVLVYVGGRLVPQLPDNKRLLELAELSPPPQEWFEADEEYPF